VPQFRRWLSLRGSSSMYILLYIVHFFLVACFVNSSPEDNFWIALVWTNSHVCDVYVELGQRDDSGSSWMCSTLPQDHPGCIVSCRRLGTGYLPNTRSRTYHWRWQIVQFCEAHENLKQESAEILLLCSRSYRSL
jgi:hypothetical protein